ncbi:MAG TPA: SGNH/GDSL hydrolase family protein, partial [Candidatus Saccharimonadales bacterium]|nr:SGNH/GDSL hydrolase family protein [Candidatus Saccharimonadales bacterium]
MRRVILPLVGVFVAVIVALGIAEVALRVFHLAPSSGVATVDAADFARLPGIFAPNQHVRVTDIPALPYWVTIDSLGFRGPDFPRVKPAGEFRLLFIGDSETFGDFVDDASTLPAQLERALQASCGPVRVINGGLGGSTITEELQLARRGEAVTPDMVLLEFTENDVADLAHTRPLWVLLAQNRRAKSGFPLSVLYPFLRNTALWNLGIKAVARARTSPPPAPQAGGEPGSVASSLRDRYLVSLQQLRDSVLARGTPLQMVLYPSHMSVREGRSEQLAWVEAAAQRAGVPVHDLLPPLTASKLSVTQLYLLPHDGHPSPRGY